MAKSTWAREGLADLMRQGLAKPSSKRRRRLPFSSELSQPTVACDRCQDWHPKGKHHPLKFLELREMRSMLRRARFDPDHAEQLQKEGIGPGELASRLEGSTRTGLEHTYGFRKDPNAAPTTAEIRRDIEQIRSEED